MESESELDIGSLEVFQVDFDSLSNRKARFSIRSGQLSFKSRPFHLAQSFLRAFIARTLPASQKCLPVVFPPRLLQAYAQSTLLFFSFFIKFFFLVALETPDEFGLPTAAGCGIDDACRFVQVTNKKTSNFHYLSNGMSL